MKKDAQVRCLNNIVDIIPLLQSIELRKSEFVLNLEDVAACNGPGLNILISMLFKNGSKFNRLQYRIVSPRSNFVAAKIQHLGLKRILNLHGMECTERTDLLPFDLNVPINTLEHDQLIFVPKANETERDDVLNKIRTQLKSFLSKDDSKIFNHEQIAIVIMEMVKNTIDHSQSCASIGLHFDFSSSTGKKFAFSYCEQGDGIIKNIRKHISLGTRKGKGGVADLLHWALTPGNSTKSGNGINYGLGTMIIMRGAKFGGMQLHLWDGKSIIKLDGFLNSLTHDNIRAKMVPSSNSDLFMFFGEMEGES